MKALIPQEAIESKIYLIRGKKVILDKDLADLYGVTTKAFNQAVKRNLGRFPEDFMFRLTWDEAEQIRCSRSQFVTLKRGQNIKYRFYVFTEQGIAMLSGVLRSPTAIQVNIQIIRVFVKMRNLITKYEELLTKIEALEENAFEQNEHIIKIYEVIKELIEPTYKNRKPIGFRIKEKRERYIAKYK